MRAIAPARDCPFCDARCARRVWSEAAYAYVRCSSCGGIFSNLTEAEYERERHNVWNEERPDEDAIEFYGPARQRVHDDFLRRNVPAGSRRLLDVGCGLGYFLARAQGRGWDVRGIDTSPSWVELANSRLGAERVQLATLAQASLAPESFALITAWDVIEHVFDPVPFLARLAEFLEPGGRLFIRTPNISYGYPVYALRRWLLRHHVGLGPTNHVVYFNARTMRDALRRAGLQAIDWPVLVPPQVARKPRSGSGHAAWESSMISAKNFYSTFADALSSRTGGRVVIGSDLDVVCAPVTPDASPAGQARGGSQTPAGNAQPG